MGASSEEIIQYEKELVGENEKYKVLHVVDDWHAILLKVDPDTPEKIEWDSFV